MVFIQLLDFTSSNTKSRVIVSVVNTDKKDKWNKCG